MVITGDTGPVPMCPPCSGCTPGRPPGLASQTQPGQRPAAWPLLNNDYFSRCLREVNIDMFCMNPPLSQGGEGGWWWRGARLSSWHQSPVSRGKCLLMEEVSTCRCVSGYYVVELVTNIMKSCIDRYYSQIIQSI